MGESGSESQLPLILSCRYWRQQEKIVSGSIKFDGEELVGAGEKVMKNIRGNKYP